MYKKKSQSWLKHLDFMILDLVCLQLAYLLAYTIRNGFCLPYRSGLYRSMAVVIALLSIAVSVFLKPSAMC